MLSRVFLQKNILVALGAFLLIVPATRIAVGQQEKDTIQLLAMDAKLSGPSVRMNNDTQVAAYWKSAKDRATWKIKCDRDRKVDILLIYGMPNNLSNQPFVLELNGKTVASGKAPGTGGYAVFRQQALATISLTKGEHDFAFRPAENVRGDDLLDLKAILLAPFDPDRAKGSAAPNLASGVDMLKHISVPDGYEIELVAGPPLVNRPISADFDEKGRLYVTESSGGNEDAQTQLKNLPHQIVRLEDSDGDGVYDKRTLFADRMMLPEGAMWHQGSLYVSAPPHIWKLTDVNDDGVADKREVWFDGKTLGGCANDLHGPFLGPDGWIYWCKGEFQEQTYDRPGKKPLVTRAAHILRRHPDDGPVEIVMTGGMNNPVDVAFTPGGERIFSTTFLSMPVGGKRDGLIHAVYGGVYPRKNFVVDGHPRTGELMPVLSHMGVAAPCGLIRLESNGLGPGFQNSLLACQFNTHKISRHILAKKGATFVSQDEDFITSNHQDFHPTDVLEDADGSLLMINTGGWYMLCCPTSRLHKPDVLGGIYRIRKKGTKTVKDPRGKSIRWESLDSSQLCTLLSDSRPFVRRRAENQLVKLGAQAIPSLAKILRSNDSQQAQLSAVWTLCRINAAVARKTNHLALQNKDDVVRQAAIHAASIHRDKTALPLLIELLKGDSLHNRRAAAEAIGRIGEKDSIDNLLMAASDLRGRVLDHSLIYALIEIGDVEPLLKNTLETKNSLTKRAALIALENLVKDLQPSSVIELLSSSNREAADAAWWIMQRHPNWGDSLETHFRSIIFGSEHSKTNLDSLTIQLARFSASGDIQKTITNGLNDPNVPTRVKMAVLAAIEQSRNKEFPKPWWAALQKLLRSPNVTIVRSAIRAIHAHSPAPFVKELESIAKRDNLPIETRLKALASCSSKNIDEKLLRFILGETGADRPVAHRSLAIDILLQSNLSNEQLGRIAQKTESMATMDLKKVMPVFRNCREEEIGNQLFQSLKDSAAAKALERELVEASISSFSPKTKLRFRPLLQAIDSANEMKLEKFDSVLALMPNADVRRGEKIFYGTKAACASCHAIQFKGGKVGPDLSGIGRIRDNKSLLESILYPSSSFVQSYEPTLIATLDGRSYQGVVVDESNEEVLLSLDANKTVRIPHDEIEKRKNGTKSIMPTGLDQQLSLQDLADLVQFLKNQD